MGSGRRRQTILRADVIDFQPWDPTVVQATYRPMPQVAKYKVMLLMQVSWPLQWSSELLCRGAWNMNM